MDLDYIRQKARSVQAEILMAKSMPNTFGNDRDLIELQGKLKLLTEMIEDLIKNNN